MNEKHLIKDLDTLHNFKCNSHKKKHEGKTKPSNFEKINSTGICIPLKHKYHRTENNLTKFHSFPDWHTQSNNVCGDLRTEMNCRCIFTCIMKLLDHEINWFHVYQSYIYWLTLHNFCLIPSIFLYAVTVWYSVTGLLVVGINTIDKVEYYFATKLNKYLLRSSWKIKVLFR